MAEQEKSQEQLSYEERLAKAMESLKGTPLPTDTDGIKGNIIPELDKELHELLKSFKSSE